MSLSDEVVRGNKPTAAQVAEEPSTLEVLKVFYWILEGPPWAREGNVGVEILQLFNARFADREGEVVDVSKALRAMATNSNAPMVQYFLAEEWNGESIQNDMIDSGYVTPLYCAVNSLNPEATRALLERGADPQQTVNGMSLVDLILTKITGALISSTDRILQVPKVLAVLVEHGVPCTMSREEVITDAYNGYPLVVEYINSLFDNDEGANEGEDLAADGAGAGIVAYVDGAGPEDNDVLDLTGENNGTHFDNNWDDA